MATFSYSRMAVTLPLALATAGCAVGLGSVGTIGSLAELVRSLRSPGQTAQPVQVTAEVQRVDPRRQLLQVETPDGRAGTVLFDLGTNVVRGDESFPVSSLGPGDLVNLHLQEASQNNLYATRIEVVRLADDDEDVPQPAEPVREAVRIDGARPEDARRELREGTVQRGDLEGASPQWLTGEVARVDRDRGRFELSVEGSDVLTVSLPFEPPAVVADRFRRLEPGDSVRVEVEPLSEQRAELVRFAPIQEEAD